MQAGFSFVGDVASFPMTRFWPAPGPLPQPGESPPDYLPAAGFTGAVGRPLAVHASMPPRYQ